MKKFLRKRYLVPLLVVLSVVILIFSILIFKARAYLASFSDPGFFSSLLSEKIECPVTIQKVDVNLLGKVILTNVEVKPPPGESEESELLFIPRAQVSFNPWKIIHNKKIESAEAIELTGPSLTLTPALIDWWAKKFEKEKKGETPSISIKSGSLKMKYGDDPSLWWAFQKVQGKISRKQDAFTFHLKGSSEDLSERWDIKGVWDPGGDKKIRLFIDDFDLASNREKFKVTQPLEGKMRLEAETGDGAEWQGAVKSDHLATKKTSLARLSGKFTAKKDMIELTDLSFEIYEGHFKGGAKIDRTKSPASMSIYGDFRDISCEKVEELSGDVALKGKLEGSIEAEGSSKTFASRGAFLITKGAIDSFEFRKFTGSWYLTPKELNMKKASLSTSHGEFALEGKTEGKSYMLTLSCPSFNPKESLKDFFDIEIPGGGGTLKGTLKGKPGDISFEGEVRFPSLTAGKKELKDVSLTGTIRARKKECQFENIDFTSNGLRFPLSGKITEVSDKETHICLEKLSLDVIKLFTDLDPGQFLTQSPSAITLQLIAKDKSLSGSLIAGKGRIREYPFSSIRLDVNSSKGAPMAFSGVIKGNDPIEIKGKTEKEITTIEATSKKFDVKESTALKPALLLLIKGGKLSGEISSGKVTVGHYIIEAVRVKFEEKSKEHFTYSGTLSWSSNPLTISGSARKNLVEFSLTCGSFSLSSFALKGEKRFSGKAQVNVQGSYRGETRKCSIKLSSDDLAFGEKKFPPLTAQVALEDGRIVFNSLLFTKKESTLQLVGSMKDDSIFLESKLKESSLEEMAAFLGDTSPPALKGKVTGTLTIKGSPGKLPISFSGTGTALSHKDLQFGGGKLSFTSSESGFIGKFTPDRPDLLISSLMKSPEKGELSELIGQGWSEMNITFSQSEKNPLHIKGSALHNALGKVEFEGETRDNGWNMRLFPDKLALKSIAMVKPEIHLDNDGGSVKGTLKGGDAKVNGDTIENPQFSFEENAAGVLAFSGSCMVQGSETTVSGEAREDSMDMNVKIPRMNIKILSGDKLKEDKLSGTAYLEADVHEGKEKSSKFNLDSSSLAWGDKKLPRITLEGEEKKGLLLVSALRIFIGEEKPVYFTGNMHQEKQTCVLSGRIEGTSIPLLVDLIGGKCADIQGNLSGALAVEGSFNDPEFRYEGRILNLIYQGRNMGDGNLEVSGTKSSVNGRLDLDEPPKYKAGIASANVEMSYYFTIGGTPKDLVIKPQTAGTKLNVNPSVIWQLFQMSR